MNFSLFKINELNKNDLFNIRGGSAVTLPSQCGCTCAGDDKLVNENGTVNAHRTLIDIIKILNPNN